MSSVINDEVREDALEKLADLSRVFNETMERIKQEEESFWDSLTKEEQLSVFSCVMRRLYEGELREKRSYRGVLYDVFGFGPESYARAQMAGYLAIHNSIVDYEDDAERFKRFANHLGVIVSDAVVDNFLLADIGMESYEENRNQ